MACMVSQFLLCSRFICIASSPKTAKFRDMFSQRMAMAGIKPHHRIALGVSGGPDSLALCIMASDWKKNTLAGQKESHFVDGLLGIIVDHRLRPESTEEAESVRDKIHKLGIMCEITHCNWTNGAPKHGHLEEAARVMRYQLFQEVCIRHGIRVLLIAHHGNDQEELFIIRLSRESNVLGLAGMAFVCELFPPLHCYSSENSGTRGILLVRPLLYFVKEDLYEICKDHHMDWVEDPSNQNLAFLRNRIRLSLTHLSSCDLRQELQAVISACRRTRAYVDKACVNLIGKAVSVLQHGYAIIDLQELDPLNVEDLCLQKFMMLIVQFISQRHKPMRGRVSRMLLDYIRNFPCKISLSAAGCYLCPAPGSKGLKVLACFSANSRHPLTTALSSSKIYPASLHQSELQVAEEIVLGAKLFSNCFVPDASNVPFLHTISSKDVLSEALKLGLLGKHSYRSVVVLQNEEYKKFHSKMESKADCSLHICDNSSSSNSKKQAFPYGHSADYMDRFCITWKMCRDDIEEFQRGMAGCTSSPCGSSRRQFCNSCILQHEVEIFVRHMLEEDWIYLSTLVNNSENVYFQCDNYEQGALSHCSEYRCHSARETLRTLKSIPLPARKGLPVLVNSKGLLLSVPSICYKHCPFLFVQASFRPRVPLGGGCVSYL